MSNFIKNFRSKFDGNFVSWEDQVNEYVKENNLKIVNFYLEHSTGKYSDGGVVGAYVLLKECKKRKVKRVMNTEEFLPPDLNINNEDTEALKIGDKVKIIGGVFRGCTGEVICFMGKDNKNIFVKVDEPKAHFLKDNWFTREELKLEG